MVLAPQVCDPGFTPDPINEYCYMVFNYTDVQANALTACLDLTPTGAQLLSFEVEAEVDEFMIMLKLGTTIVVVSIQYCGAKRTKRYKHWLGCLCYFKVKVVNAWFGAN